MLASCDRRYHLADTYRAFSHGHTYQGHPVGCAAALEVQRIIREENLIEKVQQNGELLGSLLHKYLDDHPHVGNIRGRGLFWGASQPPRGNQSC